MKISVVISAYNEEKKIEECLKSVKGIADEIIFVDNSSKDRTLEIAKKFTSKTFVRENSIMLNTNKNFGFSKASNEWLLSLDADEMLTPELSEEIKNLRGEAINGYFIPRKNIIFGKWIKHTGWYPDYQLRLFRKGKGKFEEKQVHEMLKVEGRVEKLNNPMIHNNYENITQYLNKMINTYTISEADNLIKEGYKYNSLDIVRFPLSEFIKRFFAEGGYKDGMHGLALSSLQAFYHLVVFLRIWEKNKYPDEKDPQKLLLEGAKISKKEFRHWNVQALLEKTPNKLKKSALRLRRKLLF